MGRVVGFIGGTGPLGRGLGLRWAGAGHRVLLGSRDASRAADAAAELNAEAAGLDLTGVDNATAAAEADVVVVTIPFGGQEEALPAVGHLLAGKVVVSTVVPLVFDADGPRPLDVPQGSAAQQCAALAPGARVVAGFQWVPAPKLRKLDVAVEMDVPLCSDDDEAAAVVAELCRDIASLRGFHVGPLRLAKSLESLTPLLLSANKRAKRSLGVRFAGWPDDR